MIDEYSMTHNHESLRILNEERISITFIQTGPRQRTVRWGPIITSGWTISYICNTLECYSIPKRTVYPRTINFFQTFFVRELHLGFQSLKIAEYPTLKKVHFG